MTTLTDAVAELCSEWRGPTHTPLSTIPDQDSEQPAVTHRTLKVTFETSVRETRGG